MELETYCYTKVLEEQSRDDKPCVVIDFGCFGCVCTNFCHSRYQCDELAKDIAAAKLGAFTWNG